jgi:5-methylcytosine-specific restriction protein B
VDCEYQKVADGDTVYLHLRRFGSDERKSENKVSQTMQFGREAAGQLLVAVRETFPGL